MQIYDFHELSNPTGGGVFSKKIGEVDLGIHIPVEFILLSNASLEIF